MEQYCNHIQMRMVIEALLRMADNKHHKVQLRIRYPYRKDSNLYYFLSKIRTTRVLPEAMRSLISIRIEMWRLG
ncbi:hypothetical protein Y032_0075g938 [Ancylostoma ceylanicum]|uniref:Uncharacterized protein n=1 Tax=Ancylostoma ceylanicum TaxID=53326 RepID=A0A016TUS7_9BILA|nr:hypothetical protein Y032_0075g938 [Ancylostoma ceylanicum]